MSNSNSPGWKHGSLRFAVARAAVATMITFPFSGFILPSTAVAEQRQINSNTSSSQSTNSSSNPLSLNSIFKQVENSVVQITRHQLVFPIL
jgi:hypothetical protein